MSHQRLQSSSVPGTPLDRDVEPSRRCSGRPVDAVKTVSVQTPETLDDEGADSLIAEEIFLTARGKRRVRLPASLRRGRHGITTKRKANRVCEVGPGDERGWADFQEGAEIIRIALRRSFEIV